MGEDSDASIIDGLQKQITELLEKNGALARLVGIDPLTGVNNKGECDKRLYEEFERSRRSGIPFSVAFLDIDDYGIFNKKYGQEEGDVVLRQFVRYIKSKLRPYDVFGRLGGEEFLIILPGTTAIEAHGIIERLRENFEKEFSVTLQGNTEKITASMGVASSEDIVKDKDVQTKAVELLRMANDAMRAAKADGKARAYVNLCGAILDRTEVAAIATNNSILKLIERHRQGHLTIERDGKPIDFAIFLKTVRTISDETIDSGDFKIHNIGDAGTVWSAYFYGPQEQPNPLRDTMLQLLDQLRKASLKKFPDHKNLWLYPPEINALTFLLTHKCPMKCVYCAQNHRDEERLPLETIVQVMGDVTRGGERKGVLLNLTGGEPFSERELLFAVLEESQKLEMYPIMNTNALYLTPENSRAVIDRGIRSISISLDSAIPNIEDTITNTENAFGRVIDGLVTLAKKRKKDSGHLDRVTLGFVINKLNYQSFIDFLETMCIIRKDYGLPLFDDINPLPIKDASRKLLLDKEEIQEFNEQIAKKAVYLGQKYNLPLLAIKVMQIFGASIPKEKDEYETRIWLASRGIYYGFGDMLHLPCLTGATSASILPNGDVFPCTYHREAKPTNEDRLLLGNVRKESIREISARNFELLRGLPGGNRRCADCCGPDLKKTNGEIVRALRKARVI